MQDDEWGRARAALRLASSRPDLLLAGLRELRAISQHVKHHTLDDIGKMFALASIDRPTLEECRTAIETTDEEPRSLRESVKDPAPADIEEILAAFILDALGCSTESAVRTPKPEPYVRPDFSMYRGSVVTCTWGIETTSCTIAIERTNTFSPGDVNEPSWESEDAAVQGRRRDGSASVRVHATVDSHDMSILVEAPPQERDRIHAKFWRAFGLKFAPTS